MAKPAPDAPDADDEDQPSVPVTVADPESDEGEERVVLVRSGWVRFYWSGKVLRLRRPFLGELKALRLALEDVSDAITDASEDTELLATRLMERGSSIDEGLPVADQVKQRRELQRESRVAGRALTELAERERLGWWRLVIDTLAVEKVSVGDDDLPPWLLDVNLPNTVMQHWRSVPLDRG